ELERALDHLAWIDRRVVDGPDLLAFVGDEVVALVQKKHAELLAFAVGHHGAAIVEHARPRREHVAASELAARKAPGGSLHDLELCDGALAQPAHFSEPLARGGDDFRHRVDTTY